jgi:hypothetical protein
LRETELRVIGDLRYNLTNKRTGNRYSCSSSKEIPKNRMKEIFASEKSKLSVSTHDLAQRNGKKKDINNNKNSLKRKENYEPRNGGTGSCFGLAVALTAFVCSLLSPVAFEIARSRGHLHLV